MGSELYFLKGDGHRRYGRDGLLVAGNLIGTHGTQRREMNTGKGVSHRFVELRGGFLSLFIEEQHGVMTSSSCVAASLLRPSPQSMWSPSAVFLRTWSAAGMGTWSVYSGMYRKSTDLSVVTVFAAYESVVSFHRQCLCAGLTFRGSRGRNCLRVSAREARLLLSAM